MGVRSGLAGEPSKGSGVPPKSLERARCGTAAWKAGRTQGVRGSDELIKLREAEFSLSSEMQVLSWLPPRLVENRALREGVSGGDSVLPDVQKTQPCPEGVAEAQSSVLEVWAERHPCPSLSPSLSPSVSRSAGGSLRWTPVVALKAWAEAPGGPGAAVLAVPAQVARWTSSSTGSQRRRWWLAP